MRRTRTGTLPRLLAAALLTLALVTAVAACGGGDSGTSTTASTSAATTATSTPGEGDRSFTLDELAQFDGKDGRAAYVAVDSVVYDVTDGPDWQEGVHTRCGLGAEAGKDLSQVIGQAPANMRALLEAMPVVGELAQ